ncbi:MAG: 2-amino-4-hydroxy-6-hydroxymethyldihydropteridine diphosphokinase [Myxococcales bacterium]|nr:2-amino-4-hydroxy-6-hydroxymethyldihydropteridine diphosphokinase [Myxococcales bacterium]
MTVTVAIGLGTNVGDRRAHLERAIDALAAHVDALRCARTYASDAMLPPGAPAAWAMPFLNTVCLGETTLPAPALLDALHAIERTIGRGPHPRWSPRVIDLDLLLYGDDVLDTPRLRVPHPGLVERPFVLLPLAELAPERRHPGPGPAHGRRFDALAAELCARHPAGLPHRTHPVDDAPLTCAIG